MEPWTPHALKYRRVPKSKTDDGPNEGDGDGPNQGDGPDPPRYCIICGVYECFADTSDECCTKRGVVCQFVPYGQRGVEDILPYDSQQGKQRGKGNSGEQKGKGNSGVLKQDEFERRSRLPSWMHDKRYTYDITEADVWAVERTDKGKTKSKGKGESQSKSEITGTGKGTSGDSSETGTGKGTSGDSFETGKGKGNSKSGDSFEETGTGKGKSGDSLTGKGKSGDSLMGKGKSKSGDSFDVDEDSPCSQCSTYPLPSEWASAFEEAYAQQQDDSPARPLRRWASGVLTSPPSDTVPDGLIERWASGEVSEDSLEVR